MSFDPSTSASQLAALVARCDYGQFAIVVQAPTNLVASGHPYQAAFQYGSSIASEAIGFWCVYRGTAYYSPLQKLPIPLGGRNATPVLVVPVAMDPIGQAAALDWAGKFLDLLDLRAASFGANPNAYAPT